MKIATHEANNLVSNNPGPRGVANHAFNRSWEIFTRLRTSVVRCREIAALHNARSSGRRSQFSAVARSILACPVDVRSAMVAAIFGRMASMLLLIRADNPFDSAITAQLCFILRQHSSGDSCMHTVGVLEMNCYRTCADYVV